MKTKVPAGAFDFNISSKNTIRKYLNQTKLLKNKMATALAVIATIVGILTSFGYFPQAIKIYKTKSVKDISVWTFLMFFFGMCVWQAYAISIKDFPLIIANAAGLIGCLFVLVTYFIYSRKK
jgi:MtN3 and saliva related transmembrane protein